MFSPFKFLQKIKLWLIKWWFRPPFPMVNSCLEYCPCILSIINNFFDNSSVEKKWSQTITEVIWSSGSYRCALFPWWFFNQKLTFKSLNSTKNYIYVPQLWLLAMQHNYMQVSLSRLWCACMFEWGLLSSNSKRSVPRNFERLLNLSLQVTNFNSFSLQSIRNIFCCNNL